MDGYMLGAGIPARCARTTITTVLLVSILKDIRCNDACGKIKEKGFMVFQLSMSKNNKITNHDNITVVQLMCYGKGWIG
jgi:hypothetical protein